LFQPLVILYGSDVHLIGKKLNSEVVMYRAILLKQYIKAGFYNAEEPIHSYKL